MIQLVRDMVAINHYERILGRELTLEEQTGVEPIRVITQDGIYSMIHLPLIPFESLFPEGC